MRKVLLTLFLVLALAAPASGGEWVNVTVRDQNVTSVPSTVPPPVVSLLGSVEVFRPSIGDRLKNGMDAVKETLMPARPPGNRALEAVLQTMPGARVNRWVSSTGFILEPPRGASPDSLFRAAEKIRGIKGVKSVLPVQGGTALYVALEEPNSRIAPPGDIRVTPPGVYYHVAPVFRGPFGMVFNLFNRLAGGWSALRGR
ncbi:hypothetical protein [Desulfofundulus thermosubterraneus]|uniref:Uncharacterized protein n=1 Tax=Desulfofundulus thermosubterraneus DSM 16057 TaxID=1121432 RepID=A0A1M6JAD7_9FIRM|nr:hypothetical protein [Desulfofundulus thermosubterraneus]SHJ43634.1 hypothetical protein SAMN02745219_02555 [Desulfofundulus thermosubterraneus DSM 16057]